MTRAEQKAETRRRILEVARTTFLARGYDGTTLQVVADSAGVAVGTVVSHFPDKPALVAAAFRADLDAAIVRAWTDTADTVELVDRLVGVGTVLYGFYAGEPALYRRMFQESLFLDDALGEQLRVFLVDVGHLVATHRPDLPADLAAHGFFADYLYVLIGGLAGAIPSVEAQSAHLRGLLTLRLR